MTNETLPPALVGQVERGVRPHAEVLARRLQAAAYNHGYEDASPANATTRQAKTDAVSRQTLADLLIAIAALANQATPDAADLGEAAARDQLQRANLAVLAGENELLRQDAERYRWLRLQDWDTCPLAVVANPKDAIKLGHDAPSRERLDAAIDSHVAEVQGFLNGTLEAMLGASC